MCVERYFLSYIALTLRSFQVVLPIPPSGKFVLHGFPVHMHQAILQLWDIPYVKLERIPAIDIDAVKDTEMLWLYNNATYVLSDQEFKQISSDAKTSAITQLKFSVYTMFQAVAKKESQVFMVRPDTAELKSSADTVLFVTHLRLDPPSHNFVLEAYVMSLEERNLAIVAPHLQKLYNSGQSVYVHEEGRPKKEEREAR